MRETPGSADPSPNSEVIADLNRLLRLDHDSIQAYGAAIEALQDERHKLALIRYRGDHQRHIVELARLIRRYGGEPLDPRTLLPGSFQWGIRAVAHVGGKREVLSAFRANEAQVRDEYRRMARAPLPADAAERIRRSAEDEERHLAWVEELLEGPVRLAS